MAATIELPAAGYRYIPFAFQYSGGVEALPGFRIERVEFARPLGLAAGFSWIENYLSQQGVPLLGFCACELRSPAQFTDQGFIDFNRHYTATLMRWGVMQNAEDNPVARSNVIPALHKPAEPSFHAFCFARRGDGDGGSFVIAGSGEAGDGPRPYQERTVQYATQAPGRCGRKRCSFWGAWESGWRASGKAGPMSPAPKSIQSTMSTLIWRTKSSSGVPPSTACFGTTRGRRSRGWNTKWTAGRCRWSTM
jgi:hypothetical protein